MIYMRSRFSLYQQECDTDFLRSLNRGTYLQEIKKSTLSKFDDKRCYEKNVKSKPRKRICENKFFFKKERKR